MQALWESGGREGIPQMARCMSLPKRYPRNRIKEIAMKRIALISDIHGNYKALEAFLQYIAGHPVEGIICLGTM